MVSKNIDFVVIANAVDPNLSMVGKLFDYSFPENERRDFHILKKMVGTEQDMRMYAALANGKFCGAIVFWDFGDYCYIEHLAVEEHFRGGGIGNEIILALKAHLNKRIVLEVELPVDHMSKRRIRFYNRLGFEVQPFAYQQPPYRFGDDSMPMLIMTDGGMLSKETFDQVVRTIQDRVYIHF